MTPEQKIAALRWRYEHDPVYRSTLTDEDRAIGLAVDIAAVKMLPGTECAGSPVQVGDGPATGNGKPQENALGSSSPTNIVSQASSVTAGKGRERE